MNKALEIAIEALKQCADVGEQDVLRIAQDALADIEKSADQEKRSISDIIELVHWYNRGLAHATQIHTERIQTLQQMCDALMKDNAQYEQELAKQKQIRRNATEAHAQIQTKLQNEIEAQKKYTHFWLQHANALEVERRNLEAERDNILAANERLAQHSKMLIGQSQEEVLKVVKQKIGKAPTVIEFQGNRYVLDNGTRIRKGDTQ